MMKIIQTIGTVLRSIWRSVTAIRQIVFNLVFLFLMILAIAVLVSGLVKRLPKGAALVLAPGGRVVEQSAEPLLVDRLFDAAPGTEIVLKDIIDTIEYAGGDKNIRALVLELENLGPVGISQLQEIGAALTRFKGSGKTIIASGTSFNQQQYYLAAHADKVYLHPMGQVWLSGFGVYRQYVKRAIDKLQIDLHVFRQGTYKSALDPFTRTDMSEEDRESIALWLTTLWNSYTSEIATLRGLPANRIDDYANNHVKHLNAAEGDAARMALNLGLVDDLKTSDEVETALVQLVGEDENGDGYKNVRFEAYADIVLPRLRRIRLEHGHVAVIVAEGIIMAGNQPAGRIGSESMAVLIRQVRDDEQAKALVIRLNSGGGSAMASEVIRREIELTRLSGKPVVVSMSSIAASGAYWISVAADEIWAKPTTITGSIGIFAALPTFDRALDAIGITTDGVGTTRLTGAFDLTQPLNPVLAEALEINISQGYRRFLERVGTGRGLPVEAVEKAAQGRVWDAAAARDLGLIDRLGGLREVVRRAAELAGMDAYNVVYVEKPATAKEQLLRRIKRLVTALASDGRMPPEIAAMRAFHPGFFLSDIDVVKQLNDPGHVYALCLPCIASGI